MRCGRGPVRLRTLRMALTAITNEEVAGSATRKLSDDDVLKVLAREAKKRREAAEAFEAAGRAEQAEAERAEGEVLASYLPAQLSDAELAGLVAAAVAETGAAGLPGPWKGHEGRHAARSGPCRGRQGRGRGPPPAGRWLTRAQARPTVITARAPLRRKAVPLAAAVPRAAASAALAARLRLRHRHRRHRRRCRC